MLFSKVLKEIKCRDLGEGEGREVRRARVRSVTEQSAVEEVEDDVGSVVEEDGTFVVVGAGQVG